MKFIFPVNYFIPMGVQGKFIRTKRLPVSPLHLKTLAVGKISKYRQVIIQLYI